MSKAKIKEQPKTVSLKCKNCPSIEAVEIPYPAPGTRLYRCTKCNYTWPISVGGSLNLNQL